MGNGIIAVGKRENKTTIIRNNTKHLLVNGDCVEILKEMPDNSIDLIITDPPYNVGLDYGSTFNDRMPKKHYYRWCQTWLKECTRVLSKRGSIYIISYPEINARFLSYMEDTLKLKFRRWLTWHYPTNIGHSKKNYTRSQRSILFFTKSKNYIFNRENIIQHYKNPEVKKVKERIKGGSKGRTSYDLLRFLDLIELNKGMSDTLDFNLVKNVSKDRAGSIKKGDKYHHPCQLPLDLLKILVKVSSNKDSVIFDPFAGTFTLSKIAAELNRRSIGIEINPYYIKLGQKRIKNV